MSLGLFPTTIGDASDYQPDEASGHSSFLFSLAVHLFKTCYAPDYHAFLSCL